MTTLRPHQSLTADAVPALPRLLVLLGQWVELAEVDRRCFLAMAEELGATSTVIEQSTIGLSAHFRDLALAAEAQTARVEQVATMARTIEVANDRMPMTEATGFVAGVLSEAIDGLLTVASQAARMTTALEDVTREVAAIETCVTRIEAINRQTRFVALNAAIEAQRAESAGGTFMVIARELKELSNEMNATSHMVQERISLASRGVTAAQGVLTTIAQADGAALGATRQRLGAVIDGMVAQNRALTAILTEARDAASGIDAIVAKLITGTQFQDRTSQHLNHVIEALGALGEATGTLLAQTLAEQPGLTPEVDAHGGLPQRLLQRQSLSSVRQRFLAKLLQQTVDETSHEPAAGGDIELF